MDLRNRGRLAALLREVRGGPHHGGGPGLPLLPNPLKLNPTGTSKYAEKRAEIVYGIMVRRGIVIEDYEVMKAPADGPDPGALKSTGVTSGSFDGVEKKEGAPEKQKMTAPEKKEARPRLPRKGRGEGRSNSAGKIVFCFDRDV